MPIYEYRATAPEEASCPHCRDSFESLRSLTEPALESCPECGAPITKQISAPNVGASAAGFDDRAKGAGFSKLKKVSSGEYEKMY